jgi:hypothetical protein
MKNYQLLNYIKVANIHATYLQGALSQATQWLPLTIQGLSTLPLDQLAFHDMLIIRFGKLHDILGAKIFGLILDILGEDAPSLIDKLNKATSYVTSQ